VLLDERLLLEGLLPVQVFPHDRTRTLVLLQLGLEFEVLSVQGCEFLLELGGGFGFLFQSGDFRLEAPDLRLDLVPGGLNLEEFVDRLLQLLAVTALGGGSLAELVHKLGCDVCRLTCFCEQGRLFRM